MPTKDVYVVCGRNELLTQYPELADELEEEIKRMEKENLEKQAYVEALESKVSNHDSADQNAKDPDMAFARPLKDGGIKNDDFVGKEIEGNMSVTSHEVLQYEETNNSLPVDDEEVKESSTIETPERRSLDVDHQDITNDVGKNIESREQPTAKQDLTLTHIAIESFRILVQNAQDDVKRIINLAVPVLQPIFDLGDAAWRQVKALFIRAREVYEAYQAVNTPSDEATNNSETHNDSEYT